MDRRHVTAGALGGAWWNVMSRLALAPGRQAQLAQTAIQKAIALAQFTGGALRPQGEPVGLIGVAYDTTEARQAEEDLKRINDLLEERVEAALAERDEAEAAQQRAQKLEAVGS